MKYNYIFAHSMSCLVSYLYNTYWLTGSVKYCNVLAVLPMWFLGHLNGEFVGMIIPTLCILFSFSFDMLCWLFEIL